MSVASLEEPLAPTFTQPLLPSREVMEGARVRLDCVLIGSPEPEVRYLSSNRPFDKRVCVNCLKICV